MASRGIFELHLIIEATPTSEAQLFAFCQDKRGTSKLINLRATCAQTFSGKFPRQPMVTLMYLGTQEEALTTISSLAEEMTAQKMNVIRLKVEAMTSNLDVPQVSPTSEQTANLPYFEFHFKIPTSSSEDWEKVRSVCLPHGAHLFFNPYSQTGRFQPVVTLRRYVEDVTKANIHLESLLQDITTAGWARPESIEREYSVLDTNVYLDEDWLFSGSPQNFIRA